MVPFFFCTHSHSPFPTSHFPLPISHFPVSTPIYHSHLPLPRLLPSGCYPLPDTLWLRVCTPSGQCHSCTRFLSCQNRFPMALRCNAPASNSSTIAPPANNKPHPAEKSTSVWLAIWRTWAGFANSQHRDAAFATPDNICAHSSLLQH